MNARRYCGSWCPEVGETVLVRLNALRGPDNALLPFVPGSHVIYAFGMVVGRNDGSKDWSTLTILTVYAQLGTVGVTSAAPQSDVQRLAR